MLSEEIRDFDACTMSDGFTFSRWATRVAQLEADNEKLREALCDCGLADATTLPNTHEFSCRYRVVMRSQEASDDSV